LCSPHCFDQLYLRIFEPFRLNLLKSKEIND
jgi:hypothetical protein